MLESFRVGFADKDYANMKANILNRRIQKNHSSAEVASHAQKTEWIGILRVVDCVGARDKKPVKLLISAALPTHSQLKRYLV